MYKQGHQRNPQLSSYYLKVNISLYILLTLQTSYPFHYHSTLTQVYGRRLFISVRRRLSSVFPFFFFFFQGSAVTSRRFDLPLPNPSRVTPNSLPNSTPLTPSPGIPIWFSLRCSLDKKPPTQYQEASVRMYATFIIPLLPTMTPRRPIFDSSLRVGQRTAGALPSPRANQPVSTSTIFLENVFLRLFIAGDGPKPRDDAGGGRMVKAREDVRRVRTLRNMRRSRERVNCELFSTIEIIVWQAVLPVEYFSWCTQDASK